MNYHNHESMEGVIQTMFEFEEGKEEHINKSVNEETGIVTIGRAKFHSYFISVEVPEYYITSMVGGNTEGDTLRECELTELANRLESNILDNVDVTDMHDEFLTNVDGQLKIDFVRENRAANVTSNGYRFIFNMDR